MKDLAPNLLSIETSNGGNRWQNSNLSVSTTRPFQLRFQGGCIMIQSTLFDESRENAEGQDGIFHASSHPIQCRVNVNRGRPRKKHDYPNISCKNRRLKCCWWRLRRMIRLLSRMIINGVHNLLQSNSDHLVQRNWSAPDSCHDSPDAMSMTTCSSPEMKNMRKRFKRCTSHVLLGRYKILWSRRSANWDIIWRLFWCQTRLGGSLNFKVLGRVTQTRTPLTSKTVWQCKHPLASQIGAATAGPHLSLNQHPERQQCCEHRVQHSKPRIPPREWWPASWSPLG